MANGNGRINLGAARAGQRTTARPAVAAARGRARVALRIALGCGVPGLSLALSSIGGRLLEQGSYTLGGGAVLLCCGVLAVSLSHLAWSIRDLTGSAVWQAWCLAVAVDAGLVLCELIRATGAGCWVCVALQLAVAVASMGLNVWAFLRHR